VAPRAKSRFAPALRAVYLAYGLNAIGLVPHMVFLVDFVARGLGQGLEIGAAYWVLFGVGALCGPVLAGALADRVGFRVAMNLVLVVQAGCVGALGIDAHWATLAVSSFVVGACTPGTSLIALGRTQELVPNDPIARAGAWGIATIAWALMQAVGAYLFSFIYAQTGHYAALFMLGAAALVAALAVHLAAPRRGAPALP
jgi:predicted MFS family arabinose efflux permease